MFIIIQQTNDLQAKNRIILIIITCKIMQKDLTYFEQLIQEGTKVQVVCQTDEQFHQVANQCSWCSTQFVLNRKELISAFQTNSAKFTDLYNSCIAVGTEMRREYGLIPCGENADNQEMLSLTLKEFTLQKFTYTENEFILAQLEPYIPPFALQEFNGRKHTPIPQLIIPDNWDFAMLGRHGQTFTVFRLEDKFLVLDSHVHFAGVMSWPNLLTYIKMQKNGLGSYGYLFVTMVGGANKQK